MNVGIGFNQRACGDDDEQMQRVEAAGPVDAQNAPTRSLENAQNAFSTATTRVLIVTLCSDKTVTYVAGQICYLGRRTIPIRGQGSGVRDQGPGLSQGSGCRVQDEEGIRIERGDRFEFLHPALLPDSCILIAGTALIPDP
jgi:hypothetical protein